MVGLHLQRIRRDEIYVSPYPAVGRQRRQVSLDGGGQPRWTRAGRELVFLSGDRMMAVTVDPASGQLGAPTVLFSGSFDWSGSHGDYDVTRDGERFLMLRSVEGEAPRQIVLVTNWFEELRAKVDGQRR